MKKLTLILILTLSALTLRAREANELVTQLDFKAGLSDNSVNDVLLDSRRFLWVGTNAGLDFYDGVNIVRVDFEGMGEAVQPVVFSLCEDPSGVVWAGTSHGLYHIDGERLAMCRYNRDGLDLSSVRQMCCGGAGSLWVASDGNRLVKINTRDGAAELIPIDVMALCGGSDGAVFAVSADGTLFISRDGKGLPQEYKGVDFSDTRIARIASAGKYLLFSVEGDRIDVLDTRSGELSVLPFGRRMRDAMLRPSGEIWIAARGGIHVADSTLALKRIIRPFHDNSFRCLSEDRDGGMWAGTQFEGIAHITADRLQLRHWSDEFAGGRFKARDFTETPDGRIWTGSDTRGLLCLDPASDENRSRRTFLPGRNVTGLMAEGSRLWVGTIDDGLPVMLIDTGTGQTTFYRDAGTSAYAFCRDSTGRLWIGGKDGFVVGHDKPGGRFKREMFIPTKQVCQIVCAPDGVVWLATIAGQVFSYKAPNFSTYRIPIYNILTDLAIDGRGRLFASSEGGGLWEYDKASDSFLPRRSTESRLLRIAKGNDGRLLWVTGAQGIHPLNPDDGRQLPEISIEALGIDGFNYSSGFISSDGTFYAGTSDGFISFSARQMTVDSLPLRTPVVSSLRTLSSSEKTEGDRFLNPKSLNIGRSARSFEVNVSTLDYSLFPTEGLFWKIDGFSEWAPVSDGSFTVYGIPVGEHKLRIKALALSGRESPDCVVHLRVPPTLLLSTGAFVVYAVLFLLLIMGLAMFIQRRAETRAEMEHERKLVESKMAFLTSIAHEIRTPLSLVQIPLEALISKFASSPDASVQENLDIMRRNSLKLNVLINELLDFRKLTDSTYQVHPEFLDVRGILRDAHRRFLPMFLQEGKTLSLSLPEAGVYCETDVRSLGRIFDNLLSNALKYSRSRTSVVLAVDGPEAVVSVENDGNVLPEDVRELIFKPFYRYEDKDYSKVEGTGLGLSTSRQFASLLGGSLTMDDDLSVNRFIFRIPMAAGEAPGTALPKVETKDKSVMVVEDDKDMARVIGDVLSDAYGIVYASNGRQALEKIEAGASPTLIVSDVIMPEMDGIALTKALKENLATSHIPLILLSAEVPDVFMQESLEGGADAYLEKPFSPQKLRSTVDNLIENRRRIYEFYISSLPSSGELPTGRVSAIEQKFLRSIQEYVSANLHRNITLDEIAEAVYMSPSTLYKKMKEYADISPMEYVMKMRLHKAVELLRDDSVSVQDVAQAVGFNTHSFFSECFKREFGMTPRQWRSRNVTKTKNVK